MAASLSKSLTMAVRPLMTVKPRFVWVESPQDSWRRRGHRDLPSMDWQANIGLMRSCQDFILRAMLDLTAAGRTPFRACDVYELVREWGAPCKERTVRWYVYAGTLELPDGTLVQARRVARGQFRLDCPQEARTALVGIAPEWHPLLPPVLEPLDHGRE